MYLPYDPAIALLGIYLREIKTYVYTKTFTWTLIAALFIIAKNPFSELIVEKTVVYVHHGILLSNKKD